jgi:hypothetical protein
MGSVSRPSPGSMATGETRRSRPLESRRVDESNQPKTWSPVTAGNRLGHVSRTVLTECRTRDILTQSEFRRSRRDQRSTQTCKAAFGILWRLNALVFEGSVTFTGRPMTPPSSRRTHPEGRSSPGAPDIPLAGVDRGADEVPKVVRGSKPNPFHVCETIAPSRSEAFATEEVLR